MMATCLIVAGRLVMSTNLWGALELPETTEDTVQGRLGSGSHTARVFMTWSIIIMMTLLICCRDIPITKALRKHEQYFKNL